jgi:hypothetical protein
MNRIYYISSNLYNENLTKDMINQYFNFFKLKLFDIFFNNISNLYKCNILDLSKTVENAENLFLISFDSPIMYFGEYVNSDLSDIFYSIGLPIINFESYIR